MQTPSNVVATMLGLHLPGSPAATPFQLVGSIAKGLPVSSVDRVARAIAPTDADFKHRFVSKATLARRRKGHPARLTVEESDRLARIARVWAHALAVWKSDEAGRAFLFRTHPLLEGQRPIDMAFATEMGAELVDQVLGGLEHGVAV